MRTIPERPDWHEAPERVYVVLDTDHDTGKQWLRDHGDLSFGAAIVEERLVDRHPAPPNCEQCGDADRPMYQLVRDDAGVPLCLGCLSEYDWVKTVLPAFDYGGEYTDKDFETTTLEGVDVSMDFLTSGFNVDEELYVEQTNGDLDVLPDRVCALLFREGYSADDIDGGDWVTVADGEVVNVGTTHPFRISVTRE